MSKVLIEAKCITKSFAKGGADGRGQPPGAGELNVLKGVDLQIHQGDAVSIVGPSGAGKSTLLHILGTLDRPSLGKIYFEGVDLTRKSTAELAQFRSQTMGFVFQFHHLLPEFTALENVLFPCRIAGESLTRATEKAKELFDLLGITARMNHYPSQLSGGEQQRVAIARALIRSPRVLLADEPTGNLDSQNAAIIQNLFFELKEKKNLTLIVVTHDNDFAARFSHRLELKDGMWVRRA